MAMGKELFQVVRPVRLTMPKKDLPRPRRSSSNRRTSNILMPLKLGPKIEDQIQFSVSLTGTHSLSSRSGKFIRSHTQLRPTGASHEKNRCRIIHARPGSYDDDAVGELSVSVGLGKPHQIFHLHPFEADSILGPHCRKNGK